MVVSNDNTIVEEREEILTFHEEGEVARVPVEHPLNEQARLRDLDDVNVNDVVGILQRPVHYVDFEWSATNPDTVELVKSIPLPGDWINRSMIYDKIRGFRYLKCDFKVRVQVNAQPFNAGYLLLVFIPLHRQNQLTPTNMTSFSGLTGYPHVTLDLSESTSAELTVPYNNIITHFDLTNGIGYLGDVKLFVYSPLTGSDNVDGAVWVTAENVSISLPTGVTPKSFVFPGPTSGIAQAGSAKDSKLVTKPKGAVGKVAEGVGKVAGVLKDVPVIGSIASTVEWAADAVGGIANFFGFSKPIDQAMPQKETLIVAPNIANYDGDSKAKSLALYSKNETETPVEVFGTSEDEMSFSHIIAKPVFMTRFGMKQLDKQGTIIWKWPVDPMSCEKRTYTDPGKTPYVPGQYECLNTYLSFLGGMFKYYRGSIRYHFKIVKTAFHSGRIRVFVVPGADPYTDVNRIDFNQVHSQVYDIRDTTSFDIEVPYKQNAPWKPIDARFTHAVRENIDRITPNVPTAMIYVQVINALRNPSTAAPTIDFVVSTSGAPDFQFAVPMAKHNERLIPSVESLKRDYPGGNSGYAQSGVQMLDNAGGDQLVANKIAIGEVVTGWRSLLKRYSRFLDAYPRDKFFVVAPYDSSARRDATKGPFDHFSACELLYRFKSGSVRLIARALDTKDTTVVHEITPHDSLTAQSDTLGALIQSTVLEPAMEISVPFYQETVALPTQLGSPRNQDLTTAANYSAVPFNEGTKIRSTAQMEWWRAIGEDFSFGFLVGPPTTLTDYEGRTCKWDWATEIQLLQQEEWYPLIKSEVSWKDAQTKTNQLLSDAANSPFPIPELTKIVSDVYTADNYARYMASATDAAARQYITTLGNIVYRDALAYLGTVCIPQ